MAIKKLLSLGLSVIAVMALSACGATTAALTYTQKSISSARSKCANDEDDMTAVETQRGNTSLEISAWYNALEDGEQGTESDLFKCVFNSLKIPDRISERMESKQSKQITDKTDNLYVSWYRDNLHLGVYLGLLPPTKNSQAYYGTQTLKWLNKYCQSEVGDQESLEFKNNVLGLDSMDIDSEDGSGALACISFQLSFDESITEEIETADSQDWNRLAGNYYVGWDHGEGTLTLAISAKELKE
ncbi:MAG: hypothetical protein LKJ05_02640 [Bifidobacteriaceae bacterium]|nr:hypothetical protein [Bifidobacteriaceae bacterium]